MIPRDIALFLIAANTSALFGLWQQNFYAGLWMISFLTLAMMAFAFLKDQKP